MNTNIKSAASLIAVLSVIFFGSAHADTLKQTQSSVIAASQSTATAPIAFVVVGESQDSGLGDLPAAYTAAEFQRTAMLVAGAKQDSGLGDLPATYTGAEFQRTAMLGAGAKQDSGLGDLPATYTGAEFQRTAMLGAVVK